jgi:hypothetical protein
MAEGAREIVQKRREAEVQPTLMHGFKANQIRFYENTIDNFSLTDASAESATPASGGGGERFWELELYQTNELLQVRLLPDVLSPTGIAGSVQSKGRVPLLGCWSFRFFLLCCGWLDDIETLSPLRDKLTKLG